MARRPDPQARESLLAAARAEFAARGIDGTHIEDITRRAGLSKGAFYLHFPDKGAVFEEILQRFIGVVGELNQRRVERDREFIERWGPVTAGDVRRRSPRFRALEEVLSGHRELIESLWRNRDVFAIVEGAAGLHYRPQVDRFREQVSRGVVGWLAALQASGAVAAPIDPEALTDLLVGGHVNLLTRLSRLTRKPDLDRWWTTLWHVLCHGMFAAAPASRVRAPRRAPRPTSR